MQKKSKLVVRIVRQPKNYNCAKISEIAVSEIDNPHWSHQSGGYSQRFSSSLLCGYIPYERAMELVDCSGVHNYGYNSAKICIPASLNKEEKYKKGYDYLMKNASGVKGMSLISLNRPDGWKPCTKMILQILEEQEGHSITRKELRKKIGWRYRKDYTGYNNQTICGAIKSLEKQGKISRDYGSYNKEVIQLL